MNARHCCRVCALWNVLVTDGRQAADRRLWGQLTDQLSAGSASALLALLVKHQI
ncbi:hypothetical protein IU459_34450 [Nocardia amamiensis]|uniref:Uncharacterized protein n=1 Tax=Nocardia amamiensis TaxID=404578 RepID=A0ABS0D1D9_9NOCA|nr:hypothetical protein [Nocardia amamiensis]MBF6302601.1 hypothetical protein [Nocardia amamiensis]